MKQKDLFQKDLLHFEKKITNIRVNFNEANKSEIGWDFIQLWIGVVAVLGLEWAYHKR